MASSNTTTTATANREFSIESADVLRLIAAHLTECGLKDACRVLRQESGVGSAGCPRATHANFKAWAGRGEWGTVLESLEALDTTRLPSGYALLKADVHEMAVLELAAGGEIRLAYSALRVVEDELDGLPADPTAPQKTKTNEYVLSRKRDLEQRLAELVSLRSVKADAGEAPTGLPENFYGKDTTKQERRDEIGQRLTDTIPVVPPSRLTSLLQQSLKWQAYTGQLPRIRNHWSEDEGIPENDKDDDDKRPRKRKRKVLDLVLGDVEVDAVNVGDLPVEDAVPMDPIPSKPYTTIKFGKKATAESATFCPDLNADGTPSTTTYSLVTGSSDGFVELYDAHNKYSTLRMDLPYQQADELMGHDDDSSVLALAASNDGTLLATGSSTGQVKVWRISTGKCLRQFDAHDASISCLDFSPDGSHVLTGSQDALCREFGLRTTRMLKEFRGHTSFLQNCRYILRKGGHQLAVVTSSADGTVRLWNAKTSEVLRVLMPTSLGDELSRKGASLVVDPRSELTTGSPAVHTVLPLHTPPDSMVIVPRGKRAFLVDFQGQVLRTFDDNTASSVFVAATVSPANHWLYCATESGGCCVFDMLTGKLEKTMRSFGEETTSKSKEGGSVAEISGLVHHPHRGILAAFSNDKGQKKGTLVLWK